MPAIPPAAPKKRTESTISDEVRLALGRDPRVVLWRNSTGSTREVGDDGTARWMQHGLGVGSADLIGLVTMPSGIGRFFALELKAPKGRASDEQQTWLALVRRMGGFAAVVRSADEARAAVARCLAGASE